MRELNPDVALQSRLSFGRGARYAWGLTASAVLLGFAQWDGEAAPAAALSRAGAFLLLGALPFGAINVRALEIGGRLDARRLTGRSPIALALALVGGSAWALFLSGAVLLLAGFAGGESFPALTLAALLAMGLTMALVMLLLPPSTQIDSWLLLVLLALGVISTVNVMGADRGVALGVLVVSALIAPWALPLALRRLRSAVLKPAGPPVSVMRAVVRLRRAARPELARGLLTAGQSFSTAPIMAMAGIWSIWWLTRNVAPERRDIFEALAVYGPLVLAGYDTAARVRRDEQGGGLDRIRLSGQSPWRVVVETAVAGALPFVAVSALCVAAILFFDPGHARRILARWPILAGLVVFGPLVGAFRGRRPGFYLMATIPAAFLLTATTDSWVPGLLAVLAAIGLGANSLELEGRTPTRIGVAAGGAAILAAVFASLPEMPFGGLRIAGLMSVSVAFLFPGAGRIPGRTVAVAAAAAALTAAAAEYYWVGAAIPFQVNVAYLRSGTLYHTDFFAGRDLYAGFTGVYAGAGVIFSGCVANQWRGRPRAALVLRAAPLVAAILFFMIITTSTADVANYAFMKRYRLNGYAILDLVVLTALGAIVAVLAWREFRETRRPS